MSVTNTEHGDDGDPWTSANRAFGIVRKVVVAPPYAARFDDLNGDYREVCLTVHRRSASGWEELLYADDAGYPGVGETGAYGYSDGYAWAVGRNLPTPGSEWSCATARTPSRRTPAAGGSSSSPPSRRTTGSPTRLDT